MTEIAARLGRTPAQVVLRWHLQQDPVVLLKTANPTEAVENLDVLDFTLSPEDLAQINVLDWPDGETLPRPEEMNNLFRGTSPARPKPGKPPRRAGATSF
ncbi:MAG TPA: aldo/keto reductase [Rubellimicrobium sp.]|nr:aldo/keto reductase [Rubellimicrobium sp.]